MKEETKTQNSSSQFIKKEDGKTKSNTIEAPSISIPKGGGAIKGIGEKFSANPVTGTGSMSIPVAVSPGRSGFGPQLSLSYDSGSGNGPFGFGWSLSLPSITRKTDKGLPKYNDEIESDVFILSGAEDLVPIVVKNGNIWEPEAVDNGKIGENDYKIKRYRPRIEGLFARIERWTNVDDFNDVIWRSISKDNITTWYGKSKESRIQYTENEVTKIFSWLICESYDDKGNAILYEYEEENSNNIDLDLLNEHNRTNEIRKTNRYLKRIKYGNKASRLIQPNLTQLEWMFEAVFDYGDGHYEVIPFDDQRPIEDQHQFINTNISGNSDPSGRLWPTREDDFSSYRSGFEVRTYRLCHRVLMFHHFKDELGIDDYLVRSTEFEFEESPVASFIKSVTQSGYKHIESDKYLKKSLPPVEFEYSKAEISSDLETLKDDSYENLPIGIDGRQYQLVDIDGEGFSGIFSEHADGWYFKENQGDGYFGPSKPLPIKPSPGSIGGGQQFLDLAGDGQLDLVSFQEPLQGFFERSQDQNWETFKAFKSIPNINWNNPNLKFVDLNGDGHADVLITEDEIIKWYPSLAEEGFAEAFQLRKPNDEENGPAIVLADGTQSIYLSDFSGDGLTDIVRIRNGEICYWPNLGYGVFGAKVNMDNAPFFDSFDQFSQDRIRLADIDGSGNTDIIYLKNDGVYIYLNESGNSWKGGTKLECFPPVDNLSTVMAADLLGNGTACLVWSSPLPGDSRIPLKYIDVMGGQKPHLLTKTINNLGAETHVQYAASTKFYLKDKEEGNPWITKIPFPVHVVDKVQTFDRISKNLFTTKYAYHHGYFDGEDREFRGFGMVEQWDTEEFDSLKNNSLEAEADNVDKTTHLPPVHTKTWFHTGAYLDGNKISRQFEKEYFREPGKTNEEHTALLLADTILPKNLTFKEEKEACRALKGSILHQEIYTNDDNEKAKYPYSISERNYTIKKLQDLAENKHGVFFFHARETIDYHYERNPADPRISHQLTLKVDKFGNVEKSVAIGYGRRKRIITVDELEVRKELDNPGLNQLSSDDQKKQTQLLITYTESDYTNAVADVKDNWRTPLPAEIRTYELTGFESRDDINRFKADDFVIKENEKIVFRDMEEIPYEETATTGLQKRIIERVHSIYFKDDLSGPLEVGELKPLALPYETYKQAYTPGLLNQIFGTKLSQPEIKRILEEEGKYIDLDTDGNWWIPSGKQVFDRSLFYLPKEYIDPFENTYTITYDDFAFLMKSTSDPLGNSVDAENDYRVLQAFQLTDPNKNRSRVEFDTLGMVCGTAIMGKEAESVGDRFMNFKADLTHKEIEDFLADPKGNKAIELLDGGTTRIIYDLGTYQNHQKPAFSASIVREKHVSDLQNGETLKIQVSFSYSDGFGREIQKKIQAEQGKVPNRDDDGNIIMKSDRQPEMVINTKPYRWVGNGWTIFNNKGKPVRQYEPYFTDTFEYEYNVRIGVSPILIYDQAERVIATLHSNHTYEKVIFDAWKQISYDVNDNVLNQPNNDDDISSFLRGIDASEYSPGWFERRTNDSLALEKWPELPNSKNADIRKWEKQAAQKAAKHNDTPSKAYFDSLGRTFITIEHNRYNKKQNGSTTTINEEYQTRVELDIEGNQQKITDAKGRIVMTYHYEMLSANIHQHSMEAGERWMLNNVVGNPTYAWNSRSFRIRSEYDELNRPLNIFMQEADKTEIMVERMVYGESHTDGSLNLRTKLYQHYDQTGVVTSAKFDFIGNPLEGKRSFATIYKEYVNWITLKDIDDLEQIKITASAQLENEEFTSFTTYDALNRPTQMITPHTSEIKPNVIQPGYNDANLLEKTAIWIRRNSVPSGLLDTSGASQHIVTNIDYNAKGRREKIEYGNNTQTSYFYEYETYRLHNLRTTRNNGEVTAEPMQDILYTYDPIGNITHIQDDAQQSYYFKNQLIEPHNDYVYDAMYRLVKATGREHVGQTNGSKNKAIQPNHDDSFRVNHPHPHDGNAMDRYTESYEYDQLGNILNILHDASMGGWKRFYQYTEASLIEPAKKSNRLSATSLPGDNENGPYHGKYTYDEHGNMTTMPHLPLMKWDYKDQLWASSKQVVNNDGTPETTWYVYDSSGQRVRKVTENQAATEQSPVKIKERYYLGAFEVNKEYNTDGDKILERKSLSVMDDKTRVALIETKTHETGLMNRLRNLVTSPTPLYRFQYSNHLGSASLELDVAASFISYEEYYPYGNTSFQSVDSTREIPAKRYRYTGKERDNETGLDYYGARHYASWLGRWCSCDPSGFVDGYNVFIYVKGNPVRFWDPSGKNSFTDLALFIRNQAGFEQGANTPPNYQSSSASPFGTAAHKVATGVAENMKSIGFKNADRIVAEPVIVNGKIVSAGSGPAGAPKGSLCPDLLFTKKGTSGSVVGQQASSVTQSVGDIKYGGGQAAAKYSQIGGSVQTVNGVTNSASTDPTLLQATSPANVTAPQIKPNLLSRVGTSIATNTKATGKVLARNFVPGYQEVEAAGGGSIREGVRTMATSAVQMGRSAARSIGTKALAAGTAAATVARVAGTAALAEAKVTAAVVSSGAKATGMALTAKVTGGAAVAGTVAAGVAAAGAVALAGATIHSAVTGEKTPIEIADEFYGTSFGDMLPEQSADENIYDKAHKYLGWTGMF